MKEKTTIKSFEPKKLSVKQVSSVKGGAHGRPSRYS